MNKVLQKRKTALDKGTMIKIGTLLFESRFGYRIGNSSDPAETLEGRNWNFNSNLGYLGTGDYFYGSEKNAQQDRKFLRRDSEIGKIDLSKYRLYRARNPEKFYDTLKMLTREIGQYASSPVELQGEEYEEALDELCEIVKSELNLPLSKQSTRQYIEAFIRDVREKKPGVMLSNRLLRALGYDGIDNTDTPLDNFGVGSIIFV